MVSLRSCDLFSSSPAGLTIGIVLIPQGMAYATLAGLPPVYGLYTGLPAIVYACFGSSYQAAIGPMSIPVSRLTHLPMPLLRRARDECMMQALLLAAGVASMDPAPRGESMLQLAESGANPKLCTPTSHPGAGQDYVEAVMSISLLTGLILFALGFFNMVSGARGRALEGLAAPAADRAMRAGIPCPLCIAARSLGLHDGFCDAYDREHSKRPPRHSRRKEPGHVYICDRYRHCAAADEPAYASDQRCRVAALGAAPALAVDG